jgi:hypothetical protein
MKFFSVYATQKGNTNFEDVAMKFVFPATARGAAQHSTLPRVSGLAHDDVAPDTAEAPTSRSQFASSGSTRLMRGLHKRKETSHAQALKNRLLAAGCPEFYVDDFHRIFKKSQPKSFYATNVIADFAAHGHSPECLQRHLGRMAGFFDSYCADAISDVTATHDFPGGQSAIGAACQAITHRWPREGRKRTFPTQNISSEEQSKNGFALDPNGFSEVGLMHNLRHLEISYLFVPTDLREASDFPKLETLTCRRLGLSTICVEVFRSARSLMLVDLNNNKLSSIPDSIKNLSKLRMLNLERNEFNTVPRVLLELHKDCEILMRNNPLTDEEIMAVRAEMVSRQAAGKTVPMLVLPMTQIERNAADTQDAVVRAIAENNGHVHTVQANQFYKKILTQLAAQFPDDLQGNADAQHAEMVGIRDRFRSAMDEHSSKASKNPLRRVLDKSAQSARVERIGRKVSEEMFQTGLGLMNEFANDFQFSAGHVLSYVFLAMEKKWASLPSSTPEEKEQLQKTKQAHMDNILTALSFDTRLRRAVGRNLCDTRNIEELVQLVETHDLAKLPPSAQAITAVCLPAATSSLATLMVAHPEMGDDALKNGLRPVFDAAMQEKFPKLTPALRSGFFDEHILPAWDTLKELARSAAA